MRALVTILIVALSMIAVRAQGSTYWYSLSSPSRLPLTTHIEESLLSLYARRQFRNVVTRGVTISELHRALRTHSPRDTIFIVGDLRHLADLAAGEAGRDLLGPLGIELVNPRLSTAPMYIFGRQDTIADLPRLRKTGVRVGYTLLAHMLEQRDLHDILGPVLGAAKVETIAIDSPALMARRLLTDDPGGLHFAVIYDTDPSVFLDRFLTTYEREQPRGDAGRLKAAKPYVFPTTGRGFEPHRVHPAAGGSIEYVIVRYDDYAFYEYDQFGVGGPDAGLLTVAPRTRQGSGADYPLVLTNVGASETASQLAALRRTLSDMYVAALFERPEIGSRCAGRSAPIYHAYLLDAHLGDPRDSIKGLGLWGHLVLMRTLSEQDAARYSAEVRLIEERLQKRLQLPLVDPGSLASWLESLGGRATKREKFSGDITTLFHQALDAIRSAIAAPAGQKRPRLEEARRLLVASVTGGWSPSCALGGRALWSAQNYDPFFHLALVESYLNLLEP